jgi:PTH1 family peptidyl-tRNA hydrolase
MANLVVGLGNPGAQYANTRHNAGFKTLDAFATNNRHTLWFPKSQALACSLKDSADKTVLAKPQTFMNRSGGPVAKLMSQYDVPLEGLIVIHDDLDLPAGALRIKLGGGHGGHNGIRDIIDRVGPGFIRIRVGVGRPPGRMPADRFVLQEMRGQDLEEFAVTVEQAAEALSYTLSNGMIAAQNHYNSIQ